MLVLLGAGAEERVRPGWAKGSGDDSLPQRFPMVEDREERSKEVRSGGRSATDELVVKIRLSAHGCTWR